jgi:hypothetical protein
MKKTTSRKRQVAAGPGGYRTVLPSEELLANELTKARRVLERRAVRAG